MWNKIALQIGKILKTNGNEAADFLPFARAAKLFYPKSLLTSYSKSNNPVFRLEDLGMKNFPETDKSKFHTATQDCEITAKVIATEKEFVIKSDSRAPNTFSVHPGRMDACVI